MALVLGIDSSTQSTKVEVRDAETGALVASGRSPHLATTPPRSEQDPRLWWDALADAFGQAGRPEVAAVAVAAQQHGMVVTDAAGEPLRPAKLWNDTESAPQAAALVARRGAGRWAEAVGSVPVASFTVTKLAWLVAHEADLVERIEQLLLPHDWLTLRLTGRAVTDRGDASGTGYWSPADGRWRADLLAEVASVREPAEWEACLPEVLAPTEAAGDLTGPARAALDLTGRALVAAGTGDNMAAALGLGLEPGAVAVSVGTSGTVYTVAEAPTADPTGAVAGFADATGRFLPLVCTLNATKVTSLFSRLLDVDHETLGELALRGGTGARRLTLLPYLDGERTPNRPDARGLLSGLTTESTREDLARAAFEGVVCGLLDGLDALVAAGVAVDDGALRLVGGGARSRAYRQLLADLSGRPVVVPAGDEHVALGACVQAAATLSGTSAGQVAAAWELGGGEVTEPSGGDRSDVRARYAALRDAGR